MAFTIPQFPLSVNVWRHGDPTSDPPALTINGNLTLGRRVTSGPDKNVSVGIDCLFRYLLLPKGTDVRGQWATSGEDTVEVPAGTGRFYTCLDSENVATGFMNQHVLALLQPQAGLPPITS